MSHHRYNQLLFIMIAFLCGAPGAGAAEALAAGEAAKVWHLRDDASGGDCRRVGVWNAAEKSCTLTGDRSGRFVIDSDGITLNGNGHALKGSGAEGSGDGVNVSGRSGVKVINLAVRRFDYGVHLVNSRNSTVSYVTATDHNLAGISLSGANNNILRDNTILNYTADTGICIGYSSSGNLIAANHIAKAERGIFLHDMSNGNTVAGNKINDSGWGIALLQQSNANMVATNNIEGSQYAIFLNGSSDDNTIAGNVVRSSKVGLRLEAVRSNRAYRNRFTDNGKQAEEIGGNTNSFSRPVPEGGNYWNRFDRPAEGCHDANGDGFCDNPYVFAGNRDDLPLAEPQPLCGSPQFDLAAVETQWASYHDYHHRLITVLFAVHNRGYTAIDKLELNPSDGTVVSEGLPLNIHKLAPYSHSTIRIKYHLPSGASAFTAAISGSAEDGCQQSYAFPERHTQVRLG